MDIRIRTQGTVSILDLNGPLKLGKPEQTFLKQVEDLLGRGTRNLAVNLAGVPEMDSSGISALVRIFNSFKELGGKCLFFSPTKRVLQTLRLVRLDEVLELVKDEAAALKAF